MTKYSPKNRLEVKGSMSKEGADRVGNKLANAALIFAAGVALAALIYAVRWW